jgi:hypothetical protein
MAYAYLTLADIAKMNGSDRTVGLIEENLNAAPELEVLPSRMIAGTNFRTIVRTAYPTTGFRAVNGNTQPTKSTYVNKTFETYYYDGQLEVDNAVATADEQGPAHALALEEDGHARAFMLCGGTQIWYGNAAGLASTGDALGYPGALQVVDSTLVVDAGGTTDNVSTSVWAVCANPKFFEFILGNNTILNIGEWRKQSITRTVASVAGELTAWKNSLEGYIGAAFYSKYAVGRIKKLTTDSGKGLTDSLLAQLLAAVPGWGQADSLLHVAPVAPAIANLAHGYALRSGFQPSRAATQATHRAGSYRIRRRSDHRDGFNREHRKTRYLILWQTNSPLIYKTQASIQRRGLCQLRLARQTARNRRRSILARILSKMRATKWNSPFPRSATRLRQPEAPLALLTRFGQRLPALSIRPLLARSWLQSVSMLELAAAL